MYKLVVLTLLALGALGFSNEAEALIQIERCRSYTITIPEQNGTFTTKTDSYCWLEFFAGPSEPPYQPPQIPDQPGGSPPAPNPPMCQSVLDNWPDDCSEEEAPVVLANGCTGPPDNIGPVSLTAACNAHDMCYSTYGATKASCDLQVEQDFEDACDIYYQPRMFQAESRGDIGTSEALEADWLACRVQTDLYGDALSVVPGFLWFAPAQNVAECKRAHDQRDQYCH